MRLSEFEFGIANRRTCENSCQCVKISDVGLTKKTRFCRLMMNLLLLCTFGIAVVGVKTGVCLRGGGSGGSFWKNIKSENSLALYNNKLNTNIYIDNIINSNTNTSTLNLLTRQIGLSQHVIFMRYIARCNLNTNS